MSAVCVRVCVCEYLVKNQRPSAKMTTYSENRQRNMDETDQIPIIQIRSTMAGGTATPRVLPQKFYRQETPNSVGIASQNARYK